MRGKSVTFKVLNNRTATEYLRRKMNVNLRKNHLMFWEVNRCRRKVHVKSKSMLDKPRRLLRSQDEVCKRRGKYFRDLFRMMV